MQLIKPRFYAVAVSVLLIASTLVGHTIYPVRAQSVPTADVFDFPLASPSRVIGYDLHPSFSQDTCFGVDIGQTWHAGEDWFGAAGATVKAVANGQVKYVHPIERDYPGSVVILEHTLGDGQKVYSMYGHLQEPPPVKMNDILNKGDSVGSLLDQPGNTHLHWEVRSFLDGSAICNNGLIPGPGYTYPNRPGTYGYFNPSDFVNSHRVGPQTGVDVVLIIDSSGSMTSNDPLKKRLDAGRAYVGASQDGDFVGVVDFNGAATVRSQLLRLHANDNVVKTAISGIPAIDGTNIGAGVQAGCNVLLASSSGHAKRAAILLTDGQGSFSGQDACFKDRGWPIYTFGFGQSDDALLQRIASNTGGEFKRLPTSDLLCEFQKVRAKIAGGVEGCSVKFIDPLMTTRFLASVPPHQAQVTYSISWQASDVVMSLKTPSGRVIDRTTVAADVLHDKGAAFEVYTISNPEAGDWEVTLFGADVPRPAYEVVFGLTTIPAVGDNVPPSTAGTRSPNANSDE